MAKIFKKLSVGADAFVYHEGKRFRKLIHGITPEAGLYDANGVMLASWETLVNKYNMCVWSHLTMYDYGVLLSSIIENNSEFANCTKLIIDASVGEVTMAFAFCKTLTTIIISDGIKSISFRSLNFSTALTTIIIPDSVVTVENLAFDKCESLTDVYYRGTAEQWAAITIGTGNECLTNATIHYNSQ